MGNGLFLKNVHWNDNFFYERGYVVFNFFNIENIESSWKMSTYKIQLNHAFYQAFTNKNKYT